LPPPAHTLERASVRADGLERDDWSAAQTCTVRYYNNCTGWVWVWSGWSPGERLGTAFQGCCSSAVLQLTNHLTFTGMPSGWGFTGTIEVLATDQNECPTGPAIARQPWFPPLGTAWWTIAWNVPVPRDFLVRINWDAPTGFTHRTGLASDHPIAGPTGPTACGACFPSDRTVHSYHWSPGAPPCAGEVLNDGLCDVEWMMDVQLACPVSTEQSSWGRVKNFYR
jgi:hypothetical protein